ncbi:bifunctional 2-polyprenyl-6-hydroxyphenol methylase/3-demethylubiquinol 3-O-methyltransferase UbiG [Candidatus Tisiphia endosymbiont of Nemotelus uliginosus]|uniref:bifunctional 2-polyprenyl-6-hydroxyphenol methylase/3-demethylubiquinol 3-O-methyltransferase UbiG n=1 Tax=Candidatus Tisiphia endosymbiont of Nemotelus uliginosus TaxID=3077926 RepID=UPI0035C8C9AC
MSSKTSINKLELEKFEPLATEWWDNEGEFKILHQINPIRLSYIMDTIRSHFNINEAEYPDLKLNILDVGCGGGLVSAGLVQYIKNVSITGIDALQSNIDIATIYAKEQNLSIKYLKSTVEELITDNKQYEIVLCLEVIEHVDNIADFIQNLANLVKPNGMIIISTINRTLKAYMLAIIMAEYFLHWVTKGTHDYRKFLKPSEIYSMFYKNNIALKALKGLSYNLLNQEWQLSDNIEVNYFAYLTPLTS